MKHAHLYLFLTILLLLALAAAPAQALTRAELAELPVLTMKPIVREGDLRRLYTEEGAFICPDGLFFGMPLEDAVELLPLSETMRPGEEAFDERKYSEAANGYVTLTPYVYYAYGEIDDVLQLGLEFNDRKELYACTLVRKPLMKVADMSDSDREAVPERLRRVIETFSAIGEPLMASGPEDLSSLDFAWFENGGKLNAYFPLGETYCQVSASIFMDHFAYDIILSNLPDSPAVAEIIEALRLA